MSDEKNPLETAVEQALDAFVYAPIGLLFDGPALFPKLVEKGKVQVNVARMMGQMAVKMGQTEAEKRVARTGEQVRESLAAMGLAPRPNGTTPAPAPTEAAVPEPEPAPAQPAKAAKPAAKKAAASKPAVDDLVIPDYDSLSASQVVSRLRGLAPKELDALKAYESATRARKTILGKIAQLQKG